MNRTILITEIAPFRWVLRLLLTVAISLFGISQVWAQPVRYSTQVHDPSSFDSLAYTLRLGSHLFGGLKSPLPHYLHANRLGLVDRYSNSWVSSIQGAAGYELSDRITAYGGFQGSIQITDQTNLLLPVGYAGLRVGPFHLDAGRYPDPIGLNYHPLSLGSLMMSTNAMPVPKVAIGTPDFFDVPGLEKYLSVKGMLSHGWFEQSRDVTASYLHQKFFYLKVKVIPKVDLIGGIVHQAMWGGTHPLYGNLPDSFSDYLDVVLARGSNNVEVTEAEQLNVAGNSIGAYEFAVDIHLDQSELRLHRLFYLEDGVSRQFRSPWDGMWSVTWEPNESVSWIDAITYEHVNTIQQDALVDYHPQGRARYWAHYLYTDGWTYNNRIMSLPLVIVDSVTMEMENNMIIAHHVGVQGKISEQVLFKVLVEYSRNYGQYYDTSLGEKYYNEDLDLHPDFIPLSQLRRDQYAGYFEVTYSPRQSAFTYDLALTFDASEWTHSQLGFMCGVRYRLY